MAGSFLSLLFSVSYAVENYVNAVTPFLLIYGAAFIVWGWAVWLILRSPSGAGSRGFWIIIGFAILFRLIVLPQESILDDDLYRYLWDGRMWLNGINPYLFPPNHYALSSYRDEIIFPNINYPYVPTIYPPAAQFVFAGAVGIFGSSLTGMKFFWTAFDVLTIAVTARLLKTAGISAERVIIYAWCPLVIKEVAGSGHLDSLAVLFTVTAVWLVYKRPAASAIALGGAISAKLYPVIIVPYFMRRLGWRSLLIPVVVILAYAPFLSVGTDKLFSGFTTYARYWMFNPGVFDIARRLLSLVTENGVLIAKALAGGGVMIMIVWRLFKCDDDVRGLSESVMWTLATLLLLAPTVDPWYLIWFLPLVCASPSPALLLWTGLSFLSYSFYYADSDIAWVRAVEYTPVLGLIAWNLFNDGVYFFKPKAFGRICLMI